MIHELRVLLEVEHAKAAADQVAAETAYKDWRSYVRHFHNNAVGVPSEVLLARKKAEIAVSAAESRVRFWRDLLPAAEPAAAESGDNSRAAGRPAQPPLMR